MYINNTRFKIFWEWIELPKKINDNQNTLKNATVSSSPMDWLRNCVNGLL